MDEQLKELLKDVDDKCEYSDEAIDRCTNIYRYVIFIFCRL